MNTPAEPRQAIALKYDGKQAPTLTAKGDDELAEAILKLAREYEADPFPLFTLDSYCDLVVDCLKLLPPQTVVHRLTGDGPKRLLIEPQWSADKKRVLNTLSRRIREA